MPPAAAPQQPCRLALVAMPWTPFNRPSIQLGALKASLSDTAWLAVDTHHPYLAVAARLGTGVYHWVSQNAWVCEALYAPLLFPEQRPMAKRLVTRALRQALPAERFDFDEAVALLDDELDRLTACRNWSEYRAIGLTVCFNQLLASLALARRLKAAHRSPAIVFGGSTCAPEVAGSLLEAFPEIDYAICGEGERPLLALCEHLTGRRSELPPQVMSRGSAGQPEIAGCQLPHLEGLPVPDFDDYFAELARSFPGSPFIPVLPVEFSRGCWWRKCVFCNLNLQWHGYRAKKGDQMLRQVQALAARHGSLDFSFTDNALPMAAADRFFAAAARSPQDFRFFGEIRANQGGDRLGLYRRGGLTEVQAGIEALSESLLERLNKGVSVIDNVALMRDAVHHRVRLQGNLIVEFPGSTEAEVEETLAALDFVWPLAPLDTAAFFLGLGSPVDDAPSRFGIRAVVHHPGQAALFPRPALRRLTLLIRGYRGDRRLQRRRWQPVVQKVRQWQAFHRQRRASLLERPPLAFRDGGDFLVIRQELADGRVLHHRLRGLSRRIYLACGKTSGLERLKGEFPAVGGDRIAAFLADLEAKRLIFRQGERCLALAVHRE